jgi:uncharacterized delta-60 repeat protein
MMHAWWRQAGKRRIRAGARTAPHARAGAGFVPRLESLEGRLLPSTLVPLPSTVALSGRASASQPDGKQVVVGTVFGDRSEIVIARYQADGGLDARFGDGGQVIIVAARGETAEAVTIQSDGKIVVAGAAGGAAGGFMLMRYNADGTPDTTFGVKGQLVTPFEGDGSAKAFGLTVTPAGTILAVGQDQGHIALARYNADGSRDSSFGTEGTVVTNSADGRRDRATKVVLEGDGTILVAGTSVAANPGSLPLIQLPTGSIASTSGTASEFVLARYQADGSLDLSFGSGGIATARFGSLRAVAGSMVVGADGDFTVIGTASGTFGGATDIALARFHADGSLDTGFGTAGTKLIPLIASFSLVRVEVQGSQAAIMTSSIGALTSGPLSVGCVVVSEGDGVRLVWGIASFTPVGAFVTAMGASLAGTTQVVTLTASTPPAQDPGPQGGTPPAAGGTGQPGTPGVGMGGGNGHGSGTSPVPSTAPSEGGGSPPPSVGAFFMIPILQDLRERSSRPAAQVTWVGKSGADSGSLTATADNRTTQKGAANSLTAVGREGVADESDSLGKMAQAHDESTDLPPPASRPQVASNAKRTTPADMPWVGRSIAIGLAGRSFTGVLGVEPAPGQQPGFKASVRASSLPAPAQAGEPDGTQGESGTRDRGRSQWLLWLEGIGALALLLRGPGVVTSALVIPSLARKRRGPNGGP